MNARAWVVGSATVLWCAASAYVLASPGESYLDRAAARRLESVVAGTQRWLGALEPEQLRVARFPFHDGQRRDWHFVPKAREGLPLAAMNDAQRSASDRLLRAIAPPSIYQTIRRIIALEDVLREREGAEYRDPLRYHYSVFGEPSASEPFGVRFEGHHVSLNLTQVGSRASWTPFFLGANPARRDDPSLGLTAEPLYAATRFAHALVDSLTPSERADAQAPRVESHDEVEFVPGTTIPQDLDAGLALTSSSLMRRNIGGFLWTFAAQIMQVDPRIEDPITGPTTAESTLRLLFAGSTEEGSPLYVRLVLNSLVLEYANVQNGANHVHLLIRDRDDDFGARLLAEHWNSEAANPLRK